MNGYEYEAFTFALYDLSRASRRGDWLYDGDKCIAFAPLAGTARVAIPGILEGEREEVFGSLLPGQAMPHPLVYGERMIRFAGRYQSVIELRATWPELQEVFDTDRQGTCDPDELYRLLTEGWK